MKYGVIDYSSGYGYPAAGGSGRMRRVNFGDDIQSIAIERLYARMGIATDQIVHVPYQDLRSYDGDYLALPMNMFGTKDDIFPLSPKIIPLFIGFNYVSGRLQEHADYFRAHAPIGCRDEYTLRVMRQAGIEAYLSGCLTITLQRRRPAPNASRIFLVDAPQGVLEHVPTHLRGRIEQLTHEVEVSEADLAAAGAGATRRHAQALLDRYADEAALVVTARLHCAAPCMAMGIPTVMAKNNIDINLSWMDRFAPIHAPEQFDRIDWDVAAPDLEAVKEQTFQVFVSRLRALMDSRAPLYALSGFYESRTRAAYNNVLAAQLRANTHLPADRPLRYVIWGTAAGGASAHLLIREKLPQARMVGAVDSFDRGGFFGLSVQPPDQLAALDYDFLFICTWSGREDAVRAATALGLQSGRDYMPLVSRVTSKAKGQVSPGFPPPAAGAPPPDTN